MKSLHLLTVLSISFTLLDARTIENPTASAPASWKNNGSTLQGVEFSDGSAMRSILTRGNGLGFSCGFICNGSCDSFLFGITIVSTRTLDINSGYFSGMVPPVVWSANRDTPIRENSTLQLTRDGDLLLQDEVGNVVWSTNTSGKSVVGMNLTDMGNLVLFNDNNETVWQSFDHPTDTLLRGQKLAAGQRLIADVLATNPNRGSVYLSFSIDGLSAFIGYDPPHMYYRGWPLDSDLKYFKESNEFLFDTEFYGMGLQFLKLESSGDLVHYNYDGETSFSSFSVLEIHDCKYPDACRNYGVCSNGECICPQYDQSAFYFKPFNFRNPSLPCFEYNPLSCKTPRYHSLLLLHGVLYFNYVDSDAMVLTGVDVEGCKKACLKNCSCKAALFLQGQTVSDGSCFLPSQLFSLINHPDTKMNFSSSTFIKVQNSLTSQSPGRSGASPEASSTHSRKNAGQIGKILGSLAASLVGFVIITICVVLLWKRKDVEEGEEEFLDQVPGMPMRVSHENLKVATANFNMRLGTGGFGSVFEGTISDGTKVAVKRLDSIVQGKKEFLAEVQTIGSIHHVNLVRLIGFCAEKSHRLLVYEYMSNGSLDKWIFPRTQNPTLDWKTRMKIIHDIAKGVKYLHEDCRQIIAHFDIKPENILLDENFNAKVSDFGLSKLIDKDLSCVMTTVRGTQGYLAPEWLTLKITEKVDVYSFGIVILEIVCGRRNFDSSQPEERNHLVSLLKRKTEDDQLVDFVDQHSEDMQFHVEESVEMIKLAAWCIEEDCARRPSMSMVVKVLDGVKKIEPSRDTDSLILTPTVPENQPTLDVISPSTASIRSGPR